MSKWHKLTFHTETVTQRGYFNRRMNTRPDTSTCPTDAVPETMTLICCLECLHLLPRMPTYNNNVVTSILWTSGDHWDVVPVYMHPPLLNYRLCYGHDE